MDAELARKIAAHRAARSWTYEQMAERVRQEGVPIHQSAIQKTEKSSRQVKLNELIAYSRIFAIPVGELIGEDRSVISERAEQAARRVRELANELSRSLAIYTTAEDQEQP